MHPERKILQYSHETLEQNPVNHWKATEMSELHAMEGLGLYH
jgi:hypothetical protein